MMFDDVLDIDSLNSMMSYDVQSSKMMFDDVQEIVSLNLMMTYDV